MAVATGYALAHIPTFQHIVDSVTPSHHEPGLGNGTIHVACLIDTGGWVGADVEFYFWNGTGWEFRFKKCVANGFYTVQAGDWKLVAYKSQPYYLERQEKTVTVYAGETAHVVFFWHHDGSAASWALDPTSLMGYIWLSIYNPITLGLSVLAALVVAIKVRRG